MLLQNSPKLQLCSGLYHPVKQTMLHDRAVAAELQMSELLFSWMYVIYISFVVPFSVLPNNKRARSVRCSREKGFLRMLQL